MQVCNEYDVWLFLLLLSLVASSYAKLISVMRRRHKETNVDMYCTCFVERTYPLKEYVIIRKEKGIQYNQHVIKQCKHFSDWHILLRITTDIQ